MNIIRFLKSCEQCARKRPIKKSLLSTWPESGTRERLHIDWALSPEFGPVLLLIDAATNYLDAIPCKNRYSLCVKRCLARLFGFFGLPKTLVSGNAPEFVTLKLWLAEIGVKLINTPPYNPASN